MTSVTLGHPQPHIEDPDLIGRRWRTGVQLLILADVAFVAALTFSYLYLRGLNTEKAWLAPGQHTATIWVGWAIAGVLVASAVVFRSARRSIQAGNEAAFVSSSIVALVVLLGAAVWQFVQLSSFPFGVGTSAYSSAAYLLAGANLFHVMLTAFLGIAMVNRGRMHIYSATSNWQVRLVSLWWNWIALAAVVGAVVTSFIASPNTGH